MRVGSCITVLSNLTLPDNQVAVQSTWISALLWLACIKSPPHSNRSHTEIGAWLCRAQRWLILSLGGPWPLHRICTPDALGPQGAADAPVSAVNIIYQPPPGYQPAPGATEVLATNPEQLQRMIGAAGADHTFCVQPPADGDGARGGARGAGGLRAAFGPRSMLWAFQAHLAARAGGRLSLVTFGAHRAVTGREGLEPNQARPDQACVGWGSTTAAVAVALARTHWMEARAAAGVAVDIWPPTELPTQQVALSHAHPTPKSFTYSRVSLDSPL